MPGGSLPRRRRLDFYQVSTYDLVHYVSRNHKVFLNAPGVIPRGGEPEEEQVLTFAGPPRHTRQRKLIGKAFSAARINDRAARIQPVADELVDKIEASGSAEFTLKASYTRPLPAQLIAEILGVPAETTPRAPKNGIISLWTARC